MKKQYTEPALDLFELEVEQGIAQSVTSDGFTVGGFENGGDYSDDWQ